MAHNQQQVNDTRNEVMASTLKPWNETMEIFMIMTVETQIVNLKNDIFELEEHHPMPIHAKFYI